MEFFEKILGDKTGYVPLLRLDGQGKLTNTRWFEWPKQKFQMAQYIDKHASEDVYFSPMLYSEPITKTDSHHTAKKNVIACQVVWADADTADPEVFRVEPSIIVETSEERWHTYWVLEGDVEPLLCEQLSHSVADAHREDGVDRGWGLSKRLRVPGTTNTKYEDSHEVYASIGDVTHTPDAFAEVYPPVVEAEVSQAGIPETDADPLTLFAELPFNGYMNKLFYEEPPERGRSTALHTLEMMLFEQGLDAEHVFAIVRGAKCNKFADSGRTEDELWRHVLTAEAKHRQNQAGAETKVAAAAPTEDWSTLDLLDPDERAQLYRTFIEDYADWGKAQSARSARQYHEASAWSILSTVFSEFAHVVPSWGNTPLNLFFLVLGATTRSRKSTSKNMMIRVLDAMTIEDEFEYDLGSDATKEALTEALSERPGRSSLFYVDEVQEFFTHASSGGYTAGILPMLTDAYDGWTKGVLRKTGTKKTKRTRVNLTFYGMGILTQTADALTDEDFYSGFLPRVMWVIDLEKDKQYGSYDVAQRVDDMEKKTDRAFEAMVRRLVESRKFWHSWKKQAGGGLASYGLPATEEAWARWQRLTADLERIADQHATRSEVLSPSAQRLGVSTLKMAGLLAMVEQCIEIELKHVLVAIKYTNEWAKYMEYMSRQVSQSKMLKDAENLLKLLAATSGPVTYGKALAHFRGAKSVKDFNDLLEYMQHTGMLHVAVAKNGAKKLVAL